VATLDIFIDSLAIQPAANSVPIRIDLVSFTPNPLLASNFNQTILASKRSAIFRSDVNHHVLIDVTRESAPRINFIAEQDQGGAIT
jgi:hypothetical protein